MIDINPSVVIEDSKGNRYFFYYRDSSIYYREVPITGNTKDTILISQANADFAAAIDSDDSIYITCNSRYKGILLFTYINQGWKFESVVNLNNSASIYIMDMLVQNRSVHVFAAKRLPVANLFNVYHLQKNLNEQVTYVEYTWKKNSISEIYSQNIDYSFSIIPSKSGMIHYASVWYDGSSYFINYHCYDESIKYWLHRSLSISFKNQVALKLINHGKRIKLFSYSNDNEAGNIRHFSARSSAGTEIEFKETDNASIDTNGVVPFFFYDDRAIQLAWMKDNVFHQFTYDDSGGKWNKTLDLPINNDTGIHLFKFIRNSGSITITKGYYIIDSYYNIYRPIEHISSSLKVEKPQERPQTPAVAALETNGYLKQILEEIKELAESVQDLNKRMNQLEVGSFTRMQPAERNEPVQTSSSSDPAPEYQKSLKRSNFKERFMKNEKAPSYDKLISKQDNITTFVGKPSKSIGGENTLQEKDTKVIGPEKQAFASLESRYVSKTSRKSSSLLNKLGEFFK